MGNQQSDASLQVIGTAMIDYVALLSRQNQEQQWQTLVDRVFDHIYVLVHTGVSSEYYTENRKEIPLRTQNLWFGPLYWIRTRGGTRRVPQPPTAFTAAPGEGVNLGMVQQALQRFPDEIVDFEIRMAMNPAAAASSTGVAPGLAGPAGPGIAAKISTDITTELGQLVMKYTALIGRDASEDDYQRLVDECFQFLTTRRWALLQACMSTTNEKHQFGMCLERVWSGLFHWVRIQGGKRAALEETTPNQPVLPMLDPSAFSQIGVRAALRDFPTEVVELEERRFADYLLDAELNEHWRRRHPAICPKDAGPAWEAVCDLLWAVQQATTIDRAWSDRSKQLKEYLISQLPGPFTTHGVQRMCASFLAATPVALIAPARALVAVIRHSTSIRFRDDLDLGYALYILRTITYRYLALNPGPSANQAGGPIRRAGPAGPSFNTRFNALS